MARVYLEGSISKFGTQFPVKQGMSVANIFKLISAQVEGFRNHLIEAAENGIEFTVQHGEDFLGEEDLLLNLAKDDIIITELPAGAKGGGGKIIAAIAIATIAILAFGVGGAGGFATTTTMQQTFVAGTTISAKTAFLTATFIATNLALTGLSELIAPGPEVDSAESNQAALFNGPINTVQQGQAVPIAYGEMIVGGSPISVAYSSAPFRPGSALASRRPSPVRGAVGPIIVNSSIYNGDLV